MENAMLMAIHRSIKQGDLNEVKRLIDDDKTRLFLWTPFGTWLHDAASHGKVQIVRWLVSMGVDINAYNESCERPPICEAAAEGHVEVVKTLIDAGANLDVSDTLRNPLLSAIVGGLSESHTTVAKILIESGIDTTVKYTGDNMTNMDALAFAKEWGQSDIVKMLEAKPT